MVDKRSSAISIIVAVGFFKLNEAERTTTEELYWREYSQAFVRRVRMLNLAVVVKT